MDTQQVIQVIGHALNCFDEPGLVKDPKVHADETGYHTVTFTSTDCDGERHWELDDQGLREVVPEPLLNLYEEKRLLCLVERLSEEQLARLAQINDEIEKLGG